MIVGSQREIFCSYQISRNDSLFCFFFVVQIQNSIIFTNSTRPCVISQTSKFKFKKKKQSFKWYFVREMISFRWKSVAAAAAVSEQALNEGVKVQQLHSQRMWWAFVVLVSDVNINFITLSLHKISCYNRHWPPKQASNRAKEKTEHRTSTTKWNKTWLQYSKSTQQQRAVRLLNCYFPFFPLW